MKKLTFYSLLFVFIQSTVSNAQPQLASRLIRTEDSAISAWYYNTVYTYSGYRGQYKSRPAPFANYLEFDSCITASFTSSIPFDTIFVKHMFDARNNLIYEYRQRKNSWPPSTADSFIYDNGNNLVHCYTGDVVNGTLQPVNIRDFSYNNKNQLMARQLTYYPNPDPSELIIYDYDLFNNLNTETTLVYGSGKWFYSTRTTYLYFKTSLVQQTNEVWNGTTWQPGECKIYTYNPLKLLSTIRYYNNSANGWQPVQRLDSNSYNTNGDLIFHYMLDIAGHITTDSNTYDSNHNIISTVYNHYDSSLFYPIRILTTTTYNKYNQPLITRRYDWEFFSNRWVTAVGPIYYEKNYYEEYVTGVEPIQHNSNISLSIYPSPANNFIHIKTTVGGTENCTFIITDLNGRLLRQWAETISNSGDKTIPVDDLAVGNYLLQLRTSKGQLAKQFIIAR